MSAYLCVCEPAAAASEGAAPSPVAPGTLGGDHAGPDGDLPASPPPPWDERERGGPEGAASPCERGSRARG